MEQDRSLPVAQSGILYVTENLTHPRTAEPYAEAYERGRHLLESIKANWSHPQIMENAFRRLRDETVLARTIRQIQRDEVSFGRSHNKTSNYDVFTVPARSFRLFPLGNTQEAIARALSVNPEIAGHIRRDFSERFIGRNFSFNSGAAQHVGNELSLAELAAIAGEEVAQAVAGPDWRAIADARYLKAGERDIPAIRKIIEDGLQEEKFAAAVQWSEAQRYGRVMGMVMNHWQGFAADYEGFSFIDHEGAEQRFIVADIYLAERAHLGGLREVEAAWTKDGVLAALIPMENMEQFGRRFAEAFMRLSMDKEETFARQAASGIWITPGGWHEDQRQLGRQDGPGLISGF